jgi:NAD(P)-dependent dehydrogenase (short-subunit alcohol dehydrogenase family)
LDRLGWKVFAGVRREQDGRSLQDVASPRLRPLLLDVTDASSIQAAAVTVREALGQAGLAGLVNNAGVPLGGPVELLDLEEVRRGFEVNVFGALALIQALLPLLRAGKGHIVNISSISAFISLPFIGPYAASKSALEAFSDSLRVELKPWGIPVSVIEPGPIDTAIWTKGAALLQTMVDRAPEALLALYRPVPEVMSKRLDSHGAPPERIAVIVAAALTSPHPRTRYRHGLEARLFALLGLLPDSIRDWLIATQLPGWD